MTPKKNTTSKSSRKVKSHKKLAIARSHSQEALFESMEIYQTLFEISPDSMTITDLKGNILTVNESSVRLHGYDYPEELIGKNVLSMVHPRDRERFAGMMEKMEELGAIRNLELSLLHRKGSSFMAEINGSIIRDHTGRPRGLIGIIRDISERKQAEQAIRESENRYRVLSEGALSGVYIIQNNSFVYVNPALAGMFGYSTDELKGGMSPLDLTFPPDRARVSRNIRKRLRGVADSLQYAFRGLRKDGEVIFCESLGRKVVINGKPVIMGTLLDVTEWHLAETRVIQRSDFEKLIASLSTRFINLPPEEMDRGIQNALRLIGEFAQADRSYIFIFNDKARTMSNTHEWCVRGVTSHIKQSQDLRQQDFPWIVKKIKARESIYFSDLRDLPKTARAEKAEFERQEIDSLINVPMICLGRVIGFIGFDSVKKQRQWNEEIRTIMRIAGDLFSSVIERRRMDNDICVLHRELMKTNMKLKQLALRDSQTGLFNFRYFEQAVEMEFIRARRQADPLSVMMLDIDRFKSVNDRYGLKFGDLILKQLAELIDREVRKYDTVVRSGGEEFLIITPGLNRSLALDLGRRLLEAVRAYDFGDRDEGINLTLSCAVVSYPEDGINHSGDFVRLAERVLSRPGKQTNGRLCSLPDLQKSKPVRPAGNEADAVFLRKKLEKLTRQANQDLAEAVFTFAKAIEKKIPSCAKHLEKTVYYATGIAQKIGMTGEEVERVRQAALLHDLGKIGISDRILNKQNSLTEAEYEEVKKHPQLGVDILKPVYFLQGVLPLILHHHERWDGEGYPFGLEGEEIPIGARVITIADAFEALTSGCPGRQSLSPAAALEKIQEASGRQFDPALVQKLEEIVKT